jgi:uncharacterized protein (DUF362 family)
MTRARPEGRSDLSPSTRRGFLGSVAAGAALLVDAGAEARGLAARPPAGFVPLSIPGKVIKVSRANTLQPNGLWPTEDAARLMLERAMAELTGLSDLGAAFGRFVHKGDKVAIKPNGAGRTARMASNKELLVQIVKGVMAAGVPASSIVIYEQLADNLAATRCTDAAGLLDPAFPPGVVTVIHAKKDATMGEIRVAGVLTRFVRPLTEATAIINVPLIKDHSIVGYTGCLKNITHGSLTNPQDFHDRPRSPQIAALYAQDVVKSRVRLHIVDGYKVLYDEGPWDRNTRRRVPHEALYVGTDPVALDLVGWSVVEARRSAEGLPSLAQVNREPAYLRQAGELGLGIANLDQIRLRDVKI